MDDGTKSNPFASLLESNTALPNSRKHPDENDILREVNKSESNNVDIMKISNFLESIFHITLDKDFQKVKDPERPEVCVFLGEYAATHNQTWLDFETIDQVVFERLLLKNTSGYVLPESRNSKFSDDEGTLDYLASCFLRVTYAQSKNSKQWTAACEKVIVGQSATFLKVPDIFASIEIAPSEQLMALLDSSLYADRGDTTQLYFTRVAAEIDSGDTESSLMDIVSPLLKKLHDRFTSPEMNIISPILNDCYQLILVFLRSEPLAKTLMQYSKAHPTTNGKAFENTLLGSALSIGTLQRSSLGAPDFEYFNRPRFQSQTELERTESNIWQALENIHENQFKVLNRMMRVSPGVKQDFLFWLGACIRANSGRAKLWSYQGVPELMVNTYASDSFFMSLCSVLLRFCKPFSSPCAPKLLKIDPFYCTFKNETNDTLHLKGLSEETCLSSRSNDAPSPPAANAPASFLTECFFMTHRCLQLGFNVLNSQFTELNRELQRIREVYEDLKAIDADAAEELLEKMDKGTCLFLNWKTVCLDPDLNLVMFKFYVATTSWLTHLATRPYPSNKEAFRPIKFPLEPQSTSDLNVLSCVPEFIMENIVDGIIFFHRFKDELFEMNGPDLEQLFTFVLVFMSNEKFVHNPHHRAKLAEVLEALVPPKEGLLKAGILQHYQRERLFESHPLINHIIEVLLTCFVGIEVTGQSVEFEQKFHYRRPMYVVLEYCCQKEIHRASLKSLSSYALQHMNDVEPPLFLKFVNLLINDSIFLLDEAISHLKQIKEKQIERESEAGRNATPEQRRDSENALRHLKMLCRYHIVMGRYNVDALRILTEITGEIFTHSVVVDRVASMLNYFLLLLVGPRRKHLKVKNLAELEFHPDQLVSSIANIYVNLGESADFRKAVCADGRSYNDQLFPEALNVLRRTHADPMMSDRFEKLHGQLKSVTQQREFEDEFMANAPDEFLDPIMGTVMKEPVTLPSSAVTLDRSTIARHLLSDQTDPFNRSPLTMNQVEPNEELRNRISDWVDEQRAIALSQASSSPPRDEEGKGE